MGPFSAYISTQTITRWASAVTLSVILAGCTVARTPLQTQWNTYNNPRFHFQFPYPTDWIPLDPPTNLDGRAFRHPEHPNIEVRGWARLNLTHLNLPNSPSLHPPNSSDSNLTTEQGLPAYLDVEVGQEETRMTFTLKTDHIIYNLQGRSPNDKFAQYYKLFYYIATQYRITIQEESK
ncbi:hypothetical protein [Phormidium sp. CCY1219]|uniref:hypothetical protein n=1 Tax=Phormidium sp. CCY1219 TaxID=2886104 RepID=UPI002D1E7E64|nr:hypothetical protein [Phormidium sp. CCY1219]MEB3829739.1 hypothetical protein [Phormidium sp. CCY1219]